MIRTVSLRLPLREYQEFFVLVTWDAFLSIGHIINQYWTIDFEMNLMDEIYVFSPNDDLYKIVLGKIKQGKDLVMVDYQVYHLVPNGWIEV